MNVTGIAVTVIFAVLSLAAFVTGQNAPGWLFAVLTALLGAAIALEDDDDCF